MSASREKQTRKDNAHRTANPNKLRLQKRQKRNGIIRNIVVTLIILALACLVFINTGIPQANFPALAVGGTTVTAAEYNFHYFRSINQMLSQYAQVGMNAPFDNTISLKGQEYQDGQSWQEYFDEETRDTLKTIIVQSDAAKAAGITLTDEDRETLQSALDDYESAASENNMSTSRFLRQEFGSGLNISSLEKILERALLSERYKTATTDGFDRSESVLTGYYNEHKADYDTVDYRSFSFSYASDAPTPDAEGSSPPASEEDTQKRKDEAKAKADDFIKTVKDEETFLAAVDVASPSPVASPDASADATETDTVSAAPSDETSAAPSDEASAAPSDEASAAPSDEASAAPSDEASADVSPSPEPTGADINETEGSGNSSSFIGADIDEQTSTDEPTDPTLSSQKTLAACPSPFIEWLGDDARKRNDVTVLENAEASDYTVILFLDHTRDESKHPDVREILSAFDPVVSDEPSPSPDAARVEEARKRAESWYDGWKAEKNPTEKSFAALATEKTQDTASAKDGGLYPTVAKGQMVESFEDWCFDESRKPGDTGLVDTDYGTHVMYFVSKGEPDVIGEYTVAVRHILAQLDPSVISEDKLKAAQDRNDEILKRWNEGEKTDDAFKALAKENSQDNVYAETGGLVADVAPPSPSPSVVPSASPSVEPSTDPIAAWCYEDGRAQGDVASVRTNDGIVLTYLKEFNLPTYLEKVKSAMDSEEYSKILEGLEDNKDPKSKIGMLFTKKNG